MMKDLRHPHTSTTTTTTTTTSNTNTTVAPFLSKHIPEQYAAIEARTLSNRKYCYRHQPDTTCRRPADELTMERLQKDLENLPPADQEAISHVWSIFSAAPGAQRNLILRGILTQCCSSQLSLISAAVHQLVRIDFLAALPAELAFKVLSYLDTGSLCKAAQVSKRWRILADDDVVWHQMCKQHIDRKCTKCGLGLPLLEKKRLRSQPELRRKMFQQRQPSYRGAGAGGGGGEGGSEGNSASGGSADSTSGSRSVLKRDLSALSLDSDASGEVAAGSSAPSKRICTENYDSARDSSPESDPGSGSNRRRQWKDIYSERYKVQTNWRKGRCTTKIFKGHTNGVMCLQFDDTILATGSYDCTIKLWDLETGKELRTLTGHRSGVRALQFDDNKLMSGSLDHTIKIWDYKTGTCIRTLPGHTAGVISLHFAGDYLVSGSVDNTIRFWDFKTPGGSFCLKGHTDWVNSVKFDIASNTIFSASDDQTVRIWDRETQKCLRTFHGHVGQVQQVIPMCLDPSDFEHPSTTTWTSEDTGTPPETLHPATPTHILTAALDNTVKVWDVVSGKCVRTLFGHVEGVWALAADSLRVISGAEDASVKVWDLRQAKCQRTVTGHGAAVTCVALSDSRMISGSEDGEARMYCFKAHENQYSVPNDDSMEVVGSEDDDN